MGPPPYGAPPQFGGPAPGYPPAYGAPRPGAPGIAIAGFICSLVGVFIVPILFSILGLVFGIMGRNQARRQKAPTGLATAAIWIGVAGLVIWALLIIVYIIIIAAVVSSGDFNTTPNTYDVIMPFVGL